MRSAIVVAKLLKCDGFTDHTGNIIEKYWLKNICHPGGKKKYRKYEREVTELCKKLTDAERMILGKFISTHKAMSFDAGLRIGLTAFARKGDKEYAMVETDEAERKAAPDAELQQGKVQS